jgi:hypothetical protein
MNLHCRGTHWLQLEAQLQRFEEESIMMKDACRSLERMIMHIFMNFG